jgi:hypothetical protein
MAVVIAVPCSAIAGTVALTIAIVADVSGCGMSKSFR